MSSSPIPRRLSRRAAALLTVLALAVGGAVPTVLLWPDGAQRRTAKQPCHVDSSGAPSCGAWWGAALDTSDLALVQKTTAQEQGTDRRLDIVHSYHRWYDHFPTPSEQTLSREGHSLFLNWEPVDKNGIAMSWAAIAAGRHDAQIDALAARLKALGSMTYLSFSHEPEQKFSRHGSAADFAAAFRHVHDRMRAEDARNVRWVWNVMGLADPVWRARYKQMWPGDAYVDWIAWDPYNWSSCSGRPWQTFRQTVQPFYSWLTSNGFGDKPFMLAEFGTVEQVGNPGGKADWLAGIPKALTSLPNLKALVYFDLPAPPANCNWQTTTSPQARQAFAALARSKAFSVTAKLAPS
jgi:hypothetical protein